MIFGISAAVYLARSPEIKNSMQVTARGVIDKLPLDPAISKMDLLVLLDKDVSGVIGKKLIAAIRGKHKDVQILFLYKNPRIVQNIPEVPGLTKIQLGKISLETVTRSVLKVTEGMNIQEKSNKEFDNSDEETPKEETPKKPKGFFSIFGSKEKQKTPKQGENTRQRRGSAAGSGLSLAEKRAKRQRKMSDEDDYEQETVNSQVPNKDDLRSLQLTAEEAAELSRSVEEPEAILVDTEPQQVGDITPEIEPIPQNLIDNQETAPRPGVSFANNQQDAVSKQSYANSVPQSSVPPMPQEFQDVMPQNMPPVREATPTSAQREQLSLEERIKRVGMFDGYNIIQEALAKENINRELMQTDSEYAGARYSLEEWDREILAISRDTGISSEEKWDRIRELAYKRAQRKGTVNNKLMDKISVIISTITQICEDAVNDKVNEIKRGLSTVVEASMVNMDEAEVSKLIQNRNAMTVEVNELLMNILSIYKLMDKSVDDFINTQADGLPSENDYINNQFSLEKDNFKPYNIGALTTRILTDLKSGLISFAQMEKTLTSLSTSLTNLVDQDSDIIIEQEKRYSRLKSIRVEETVTITNVLKNSLRVFVGSSDCGTTATALTWAGLRSRRQNTILIDLRSDNNKMQNYGITATPMEDFLNSSDREQFVVLKGNITSITDLDDLLAKLTGKVNYYSSINLIFDIDQVDYVNRCVEKALSINIITDSTVRSVENTKMFISNFKPVNVGVKLISIDPVVERLEFLRKLNADDFVYQIVSIPNIKDMRLCSIRNEKPYLRGNVRDIFEEAFR